MAEGEVTRLLQRWNDGDSRAIDDLLPLVYGELRQLAGSYLRRERAGHTLAPTALVHEAYLRLAGSDLAHARLEERSHFFAVAAQAMRRILVEHARRHNAARRPSSGERVELDDGVLGASRLPTDPLVEVLAVHESLEQLKEVHPRKARVVELRYFGGLSESEVAELLGVSRASVARDWRVARLLLGDLLTADVATASAAGR
jgi:RNA polymerase sigma factor (TIGR02999 family)